MVIELRRDWQGSLLDDIFMVVTGRGWQGSVLDDLRMVQMGRDWQGSVLDILRCGFGRCWHGPAIGVFSVLMGIKRS